jgi:outer membrane biosynthesis protein TonB
VNRGALPLAILIVAALAAGIVVAIIQPGDLGEEAAPEPTATAESPLPTTPASPEPTIETPSPEPTEEPSPEPTEEPTPEPEPNGGAQNGQAEPTLAETGGPVLPWLLGGALLTAAGAGLWRLRRRLD